MTIVDRLLVHAGHHARRVWSAATPAVVEIWCARGDHAHAYAHCDLTGDDKTRAVVAALDPDPDRARAQSLIALASTDGASIEAVALVVPRRDPVVAEHALAAARHFARAGRRNGLAFLLGTVGELASVESLGPDATRDAGLVAWAATRMAPEHRLATLEQAWEMPMGWSEHVLVMATRSLGAWQVVPTNHRALAARYLAIDGRDDVITSWLAATEREHDRNAILVHATVDGTRIAPDREAEIRRCAAEAEELYVEGLLTSPERDLRLWAAAVCEGRDAVDAMTAAGLVAARAAADDWLRSLGTEEAPVNHRSLVMRYVAKAKSGGRIRDVFRVLRNAGSAGDRETVRVAIDELEQLEPLDPHDAASARVYYPGRSRDVAAGVTDLEVAETYAHLALGLAADGHVDDALGFAERVLDERPEDQYTISPVLLGRIAGLVLRARPEIRERLLVFVDGELEHLPARTLEAAADWLTDPIGASAPRPPLRARSAELETQLAALDGPAHVATALVYADWLLGRGDPRGELIGLQHAGKLAEADALIARHRDHFLGAITGEATLTWRLGFIDSARLIRDVASRARSTAATLAALLDHPSGALLRSLVLALAVSDDGTADFAPAIAVLGARAPTSLRRLRIGDFRHSGPRNGTETPEYDISWSRFGDVEPLWPSVQGLTSLTLQGCFPAAQLGSIDVPALRELTIISGGLAGENTRDIASVVRPQLETLELWFGQPEYGFSGGVDDVLPLLDARTLPRLRTLRLMNADFADALIEPLARSTLLPQLHGLSLALGTLSDHGATVFAQHARAFAHLEVLDLDDNCLTDAGAARIGRALPQITCEDQKTRQTERYVSVGE